MNFDLFKSIAENMARVIVGKDRSVELVLVSLLGDGHVLLEDVPGVGKTLVAKSLAKSIDGSFKRIQFTPDLLPSDVTGFNVYDQKSAQFRFQPGPVMSNILLADEINRTVPRTQASLLESMEERQITIDGQTRPLPHPFFVIATQNPIELEGTFPLPEAQMDRFLMKIQLGYPDKAGEVAILERFQKNDPLVEIAPVAEPMQVFQLQRACRHIRVSALVREYIADIVGATRSSDALRFGASPRGAIGLMRASQALAAIRGREYVLPDDVKYLARPVLGHRLIPKTEERLRGGLAEDILEKLMDRIPAPIG